VTKKPKDKRLVVPESGGTEPSVDLKKAWQTPELTVMDVPDMTQSGTGSSMGESLLYMS
jgi:hypothetical protein